MAHVMIIDDDEDFADAAAMVLRRTGREVEILLETQNALDRMEKRKPDLVVLDVMFPEDSAPGFGLARAIRHHSQPLKDVPLLMLTTVNAKFSLGFGPSNVDEQRLPVTDFVAKPVDLVHWQNKEAAMLGEAASGRVGPDGGARG
jgi:CheY-like chemotaxis protein